MRKVSRKFCGVIFRLSEKGKVEKTIVYCLLYEQKGEIRKCVHLKIYQKEREDKWETKDIDYLKWVGRNGVKRVEITEGARGLI